MRLVDGADKISNWTYMSPAKLTLTGAQLARFLSPPDQKGNQYFTGLCIYKSFCSKNIKQDHEPVLAVHGNINGISKEIN